jgi:hypothetical protein
LYLADPRNDVEASLHEEQEKRDIVVDELDSEAQAPNVPILHDRRRVYDVSVLTIVFVKLDQLQLSHLFSITDICSSYKRWTNNHGRRILRCRWRSLRCRF